MKWIFIAFLAFVFSLFFREQRLPPKAVEAIVSGLPVVLKCDGIFFGFRKGFRFSNVRIYDSEGGKCLRPLVSAKSISVDPLTRRVNAEKLKYTRLPESYYLPVWKERNERLELSLPDISEFDVVLDEPDILGLRPDKVRARFFINKNAVFADDIRVLWAAKDDVLAVNGFFRLDVAAQTIHAEATGEAFPSQIRPFIVSLDVPVALPYMDAFTEIENPVSARGRFDVNLVNNDFRMKLHLKPEMGCYNGVAMSRAEGTLDLYSFIRGTNSNVKFSVDLPLALDKEGHSLSGVVKVDYSNDVTRLSFDAKSALHFKDALAIADFIDPASLDVFKFDTPPQVTVKGTSGTSAADKGSNDLAIDATAARMSFLDFKLENVKTSFTLKGDTLDFPAISAFGKTGGRLAGSAKVFMPDFEDDKMSFRASVAYEKGSLEELADFLHFDLGERHGTVSGEFEFSGPIATNAIDRLNGSGKIEVTDGHLAQMKLFAGLTALLANKVPGVGFLVNQSSASADFTITNGVFASDNIYIEGGFISLKAWGTYDIPKDDLGFTVRVQFLKNDSIGGMILHPITWPFTKLLLEFKAKGKIDSPDWEYISIIDRVL